MKTVMSFNTDNNFFIEFVTIKDKLKIEHLVFIPFIRNIRHKLDKKQLKIRMMNYADSFYISSEKTSKLKEILFHLQELLQYIKRFKYAIHSWRNLLFKALFELKIFKNKEQAFREKDVKQILSYLKIKGKKRLKNAKKSYFSNKNETSFHYFNYSIDEDELEDIDNFYSYIKNKLMELISKGKTDINISIIEKIFQILMQKNELVRLYERINKINLKNKNPWKYVDESQLLQSMILDTQTSFEREEDHKEKMSFSKFLSFLSEVQEEEINETSKANYTQFFNHIRMRNIFDIREGEVKSINFNEFCMFIFSKANAIFDPAKQDRHHNMKLPISQYFISSSHNTYLVGHQLYGKSGLEGYQRAVEQGYRCLEIDCWDGSNGEPRVTHGRTMTTDYSFEKIIKFLSGIAFKNNKYPLILSLEMHCSYPQREKIAHYIQKYFKDRLFILNAKNLKKDYTVKELKGKVLIKTDSPYPTKFQVNQDMFNQKYKDYHDDTLSYITSIFKEKIDEKLFNNPKCPGPQFKTKFGIMSLSDTKFNNLVKTQIGKNRFSEFSKDNMVRIYPDGTKISSRNYNPIRLWEAGCQMACLNLQTPDEAVLINLVKFMENGGRKCGYLKKPDYLIKHDEDFVQPRSMLYTIGVISVQTLTKVLWDENDILEVYVKGHFKDEILNKQVYKLNIQCNFLHPILLRDFDKQIQFNIMYPELAVFIFKVRNGSILKNIGCVPADCFRSGFRVLSLYDDKMYHNRFSYLLLKIEKKLLSKTRRFS